MNKGAPRVELEKDIRELTLDNENQMGRSVFRRRRTAERHGYLPYCGGHGAATVPEIKRSMVPPLDRLLDRSNC